MGKYTFLLNSKTITIEAKNKDEAIKKLCSNYKIERKFIIRTTPSGKLAIVYIDTLERLEEKHKKEWDQLKQDLKLQ